MKTANNCESAGWVLRLTLDFESKDTQTCDIPYYDDEGTREVNTCEIRHNRGHCGSFFADNDNDGVVDFPAPVSDGSGGHRRFITYCQGGGVAQGRLGGGADTFPATTNDKGQTQCCPAGMVDADQDPDTPCTEPIGDIAIGGAIIPDMGDIVPTAAICTGLGGETGTNSNGDATCYGHIVPGRDTAETGCVISASGSCKADFEKIRECHVAEKLTKG